MKKQRSAVGFTAGIALSLLAMVATLSGSARAQPGAEDLPRAWLGVTLADVEIAGLAGLAGPDSDSTMSSAQASIRRAMVTGVAKGSPADRAELRAGDTILAVNGEPVDGSRSLIRLVAKQEQGSWIEITLSRQGQEVRVSARLEPKPEEMEKLEIKRGWAGARGIDVPAQLQEYWGGEAGRGALVGVVVPTGPADIAGLLPGDLILSVGGRPVGSARDLARAFAGGGIGNQLVLEVSRQGTLMDLELELAVAPSREEIESLERGARTESSSSE